MRFWIQATRTAFAGVLLVGGVNPAWSQWTQTCPATENGSATGIVRGVVVDADTRVPLRRAEVQLSWRREGERRQRTIEVETDGRGEFIICDAPADARLLVKASFSGKSSRGEPVEVATGRTTEVDLKIDAPHSEIVGRVVEHATGRPITAATVRLRGTPLSQVTPQDGKFKFSSVPPGSYQVEVQHVGYRAVSDSVRLQLGTNMDITARLAPTAIPLEPLVVTVRSLLLERRGFYERQQRGLGSYISREDFERRVPTYASDLLRSVTGIQLVRRNGGAGYAPVGRGSCAFRYILNGNRIGPGFEIDDIAAEWIEAIEIYRGPSSIPIEFAPMTNEARSSCGVIVIWTRSR